MKFIKKTLAITVLAAPMAISAQLACTMPNGVVVQKNFGNCPTDAVKIQKPDGTLLPIAPPRPKTAPAPPPPNQGASPVQAPQAQPSKPPEPNTYDYAQLICRAFESVGASDCKVDSSVFTTSYIDATIATSPHSAADACRDVVSATRKKTNAFGSGDWKIRIFSPFSGNRPIAACNL